MSLTDERKKLEKNKDNLKAARTSINNKFVELGGSASTSFNNIPEKTTELANTITATNKAYIDSKTGNLSNLQTKSKDNLVNAINEVNSSSGGFGLIFDSNSEKTGNGNITTDNLADNGKAISLAGSTANIIAYFKTDKLKLGRYGFTIRVKTSNNTLDKNILKVEILKCSSANAETNIKTINFTGTDFKAANQYCWLTSYFDYSLAKAAGDKVGIKVSIGDSIGTNVSLSVDYIAISPLMSAQYVIG